MFNPSFVFNEIVDSRKRKYMMEYLSIKYLNKSIPWYDHSFFAKCVVKSCLSCILCILRGFSIKDSRGLPELTHDALCAFYGDIDSGSSILSKFGWTVSQVYKIYREYSRFFNTYMFIFNKMLSEKKLLDKEKDMLINEIQNLFKDNFDDYKNNTYYPEDSIKVLYEDGNPSWEKFF